MFAGLPSSSLLLLLLLLYIGHISNWSPSLKKGRTEGPSVPAEAGHTHYRVSLHSLQIDDGDEKRLQIFNTTTNNIFGWSVDLEVDLQTAVVHRLVWCCRAPHSCQTRTWNGGRAASHQGSSGAGKRRFCQAFLLLVVGVFRSAFLLFDVGRTR
jgi:hypothetical protein